MTICREEAIAAGGPYPKSCPTCGLSRTCLKRARVADRSIRPIRVIVESPYAGNVDRNVEYARAAVRDSVLRGEAPIASHLLFTQPGILDDDVPAERSLGIEAGLAWGSVADKTVVYTDRGVSSGMAMGIKRAHNEGRPVEYRQIAGWSRG